MYRRLLTPVSNNDEVRPSPPPKRGESRRLCSPQRAFGRRKGSQGPNLVEVAYGHAHPPDSQEESGGPREKQLWRRAAWRLALRLRARWLARRPLHSPFRRAVVIVGRWCLRDLARDQHLADAAPVSRLDRQPQSVDVDRVTRCGHATDAVVDEAADGVVLLGVLELQVEVEQFQQLVDVGPAIDPRLVLGQADDHRLLDVVLILDLADDLLEQVLDRDEAGRPAVLVE